MNSLTVTAKGQITLSKELLEHLGVHPGDRIAINKLPQGILELGAVGRMGQISDVFGLLKNKTTRVLSIDEINDIAARGWARLHRTPPCERDQEQFEERFKKTAKQTPTQDRKEK